MIHKDRLSNADEPGSPRVFCGPSCDCLRDFFREEILKHHQCLERQREYYSEVAITQAEEALARIMARLEQLCQREDASEVICQLLKQFDVVTKLSAWTDVHQLH